MNVESHVGDADLEAAKNIRSPRIHKREQGASHRWHVEIPLATPSGVDRQLTTWLNTVSRLANGDRERKK